MKKIKVGLFLSTVLVVSLLATGCKKEIEVKNGSKVAVSTKDFKYTATEYYEKIKEKEITTLIDMIDHDFLYKKYKADSKETKEIDNQVKQIRSYAGDSEESFVSLIQQYFGVNTEQELRDMFSLEYKRKLAVEDYIKGNLKDDEIQEYYDEEIYGEVQASHILIKPEELKDDATDEEKEAADKAAKEKAESIIKQLEEGKDFAELAKENSKDEANASKGGDLGYFDVNTMVEEFKKAVIELKVNEYSKEPVKTTFGYHIILKTGEKEKPKLDEVKDKIKDTLTNNKLNEDKAAYYETLKAVREKNKISWNDDVLKDAYTRYMDNLINNAKNS